MSLEDLLLGKLKVESEVPKKEQPKEQPSVKPKLKVTKKPRKVEVEEQEGSEGPTISLDQRRIWETIYLLTFGHRARASTIPGLKQEYYDRLTQKLQNEGII